MTPHASAFQLGIVMNVPRRETSTLDEEHLYAQKRDGNSKENEAEQ